MREIKFRAQQFNHGNNGFQYGSYVTDEKDYHAIIKESKSAPDEMYNILINPETLGQFTGLKDKNGVDIYEGDICVNESGRVAKVIWFESGACFDFIALNEAGDSYGYSAQMARYKLSVIGNVYENKELLDSN